MGYVSNPKAPAYAASKAGVVNLTRALAARWAADGIRVNAVAPGYVETAMTEAVRADNALADALLQRQKLGRWGRPEEIAEMIVWLLSGQGKLRYRLDASGRRRLPDQLRIGPGTQDRAAARKAGKGEDLTDRHGRRTERTRHMRGLVSGQPPQARRPLPEPGAAEPLRACDMARNGRKAGARLRSAIAVLPQCIRLHTDEHTGLEHLAA